MLQELLAAGTKSQRGPVVSTCPTCKREKREERSPLMTDADAANLVRDLLKTEHVVPASEMMIENTLAIAAAKRSATGARGVQWYDASIVAAAQLAGCEVLLSQDMQHGETIAGVRIENPFKP